MSENLVNDVLEKFFALGDANKELTEEFAQALKEYEDYCISSDADLDKKTGEIIKKIGNMDSFMQYAREHATDLEDAAEPFETPEGVLESLRQKIALQSHNDPNAETLYTKASGQKLLYQKEIERVRNLIGGSKVQAKRMYDSTLEKLNEKKSKQDGEYRAFIFSEDFKNYLKLLTNDAATFNSSGTVQPDGISAVSLGQRRVRLPVPEEFEQELTVSTGGVFNSAAKTIGAPLAVAFDKGGVVYIDFDEKNEAYMLGGIQRFLLNSVKYFGKRLDSIFFLDPVGYCSDGLGHIGALSKGNNSFITLPESKEAAREKLSVILEELNAQDNIPTQVNRIFVFRNFPESYEDAMAGKIRFLCENAEKLGIVVLLTHMQSVADAAGNDNETAVRQCSMTIRSRNGGFYLENSREGFLWYSAPASIPDEVRRTYIEQRRSSEPVVKHIPTPASAPAAVVNQPIAEHTIVEEVAESVVSSAAEPIADTEILPTIKQHSATEPDLIPEEPESEQAREIAEDIETLQEISEEPVQTAPVQETPAPTEKPPYSKGIRRMDNIVLGAGEDAAYKLNLEENPITHIVAEHPSREVLLHNIIDGVIGSCHPDDVELWLFDLEKSTLLKYTEKVPPHVRYLVLDDSCERVSAALDRLSELVRKRANLFRGRWNSFADAPKDIYIPEILVVIDGFSALLRLIGDIEVCDKLHSIIERGVRYGLRFVISDTSNEDSCESINCLDINSKLLITADSLENATVKTSAMSLKLTIQPASEKNVSLPEELHASDTFEPDNQEAYLDKKPVIADGTIYRSFAQQRPLFEISLAHKSVGDMLIFAGEPLKLCSIAPIRIFAGFAENILISDSANEREASALLLLSITSSLTMQDIPFEVFSAERDALYTYLGERTPSDAEMTSEGIDKVCERIEHLATDIADRKADNRFIVFFGISQLVAEMTTLGEAGQRALANLAFILEKGARLGYHFAVILNSTDDISELGISPMLFRHKLETAALPEHCFIYNNGRTLFAPYLHKGISLDCFEVDDNGGVSAVFPEGMLI